MTRGNKGRLGFISQMEILFRCFTRNVGVHPAFDGGFHHALGTPGTPGDRADLFLRRAQDQGRAAECIADVLPQALQRRWFASPPPYQVVGTKSHRTTFTIEIWLESEARGELGVITPFG